MQAGNRADSILRLSLERSCYNSYPQALIIAAALTIVIRIQNSVVAPFVGILHWHPSDALFSKYAFEIHSQGTL
jgi:hypothetical protein